ncbi:hypothetical protein K1T71_000930 [Dendrolimus kikuchii]|uniref:Uncharacterized protein n=1 Tax=Dendrolimus kikuchii TaxID=765133 RepID=A0ACC1DG68_9NEOP|nr:hypothetical protein K1T71_000930 [Dendrolimus kikuchii]
MADIPFPVLKAAWQGFCLDQQELRRVLCYCEVYIREESVPFMHFIAVAGGMLTKCLTHTMILLCETLTKEPDGGSAAIPVSDFLTMYKLLAKMDASKDVKYSNGYREGVHYTLSIELMNLRRFPDEAPETVGEEEEGQATLSGQSSQGDRKLRELSVARLGSQIPVEVKEEEKKKEGFEIFVYDEEGNDLPFEFYGEEELPEIEAPIDTTEEIIEQEPIQSEAERIALFVAECFQEREERLEDLERTFEEISAIVDRFKSANYDLGMVAGRQMSTTSGEFIVQHVEREIMDYINEQIAILPDPDLKKKKAKPEEVMMIREILENFLDENMDIIVPEVEEVEEEEQPIPEIVQVYAIPGIGPPVDEDIIHDFVEYAIEVSRVQADHFMPRNIRHFLCPPLEKFIEYNYDEDIPKKEEKIAVGGVITD